jgi:hypothetical protein
MARPFDPATFQTDAFQGETLSAAASFASIEGLISESRQVGLRAAAFAFADRGGISVPTVRVGGKATGIPAVAPAVAGSGKNANRGSASALASSAVLITTSRKPFQVGAFQTDAFQGFLTERVTARAAAANIASQEGVSVTARMGRKAALSFGQSSGHTFTALTTRRVTRSIGASLAHGGSAKAVRRAALTFAVTEDEINRYRSDGTGSATFPFRAGLTSTSIGTAFKEGFQANAFEQTVDNPARAHMLAPLTIGAVQSATAQAKKSTRASPPAFGAATTEAPTTVVTHQAGASFGSTAETFRLRSLIQIYTGLGFLAVKAALANAVGRNAATARGSTRAAAGSVAGNGSAAVAITRTMVAVASLAGRGREVVTALAGILGIRGALPSGSAATVQRPAATQATAADAAPTIVRVAAKPAACLTGRAEASPTLVRLALSTALAIALRAALSGVGRRATSDAAALGETNSAAATGHRTTYGQATLTGAQFDHLPGTIRVIARPVGPVAVRATIPANSNRVAGVAAQALTAKFATPAIVRLGRFALSSALRAALAVAGLFNPQLVDLGQGATLKNDHARLRALLRGAPRQRGLRNAKPRNRSLP